jgi:hypothetical protein
MNENDRIDTQGQAQENGLGTTLEGQRPSEPYPPTETPVVGQERAPVGQKTKLQPPTRRNPAPALSLARRSIAQVDGRAWIGQQVKRWRKWAVKEKGGVRCPANAKTEITLAAFDLLRILYLQSVLIEDMQSRGTIVSKRTGKLASIHARYDQINWSFMRRCESLGLSKAEGVSPLDAMGSLDG